MKYLLPDGSVVNRSGHIPWKGNKLNIKVFDSVETLKSLGIKPINVMTYNSSYYNTTGFSDVEQDGVVTRTYTLQPKLDLAVLKTDKLKQLHARLSTLLQPTDWYVIRSVETPQNGVPDEITAARNIIRIAYNAVEEQIQKGSDYDIVTGINTNFLQ